METRLLRMGCKVGRIGICYFSAGTTAGTARQQRVALPAGQDFAIRLFDAIFFGGGERVKYD